MKKGTSTPKKAAAKKSPAKKATAKPVAMKVKEPKAEAPVEATMAPAKEKKKVAEKPAKPTVEKSTTEILSALYGINDVKVEAKDKVKVGRKITNKMIGSDPVPGEKKELIVKAIIDGKEVEKTFAEGEKLTF